MNKKGEMENKLVGIILLVMVLFIGFALLTPVATQKGAMTDKADISNESLSLSACYAGSDTKNQVNTSFAACNITVTNAPTDWKLTEGQCALGTVSLKNNTGTALVLNTDYRVVAQTGIVQFLNTTKTAGSPTNESYIAYNYCRDGYLTESGDRSLFSLITTVMIMVLLITAALYAMKQFKE